jgi:hypothetical protein
MKLSDWKNRDMFDWHNIIDASDLSRAIAQRFNGTATAKQSAEVSRPITDLVTPQHLPP